MSTREEHPLDERFRALLYDAEMPPPPEVWAAVRQGIPPPASRRRWPFWLLIVAAGGAALWAGRPGNDPAAADGPAPQLAHYVAAQESTIPTTGAAPARSVHTAQRPADPMAAAPTGRPNAGDAAPAPSPARPERTVPPASAARSAVPLRTSERSAPGPVQDADGVGRVAHVELPVGAVVDDPVLGASPAQEVAGPAVVARDDRPAIAAQDDAITAAWMPVLHPSFPAELPEPPPFARLIDPVVLPRAEWWVGVQVGSYQYRYRWQGDDTRLTDALSGAHGTDALIVPGLSVKRQWRSGWGVAAGLWAGMAEHRFHASAQRSWVEQEITTHVVALNGQVFEQTVDTISHHHQEWHTLDGSARRTVLWVPVEAVYTQRVRRLQLGVRAGVVAELPISSSGTLLGHGGADGPLTALPATADQLRARRPAALVLTAGLEVGTELHARWALAAGVRYMQGVRPFGAATDAYGLAERWGLECRLMYHIRAKR